MVADFSFKFTKKYKHSVILERILGYKQRFFWSYYGHFSSLNISLIPGYKEFPDKFTVSFENFIQSEKQLRSHSCTITALNSLHHLLSTADHHSGTLPSNFLQTDVLIYLETLHLDGEIFSESCKKVSTWKLSGVCLQMHFKVWLRRFGKIYISAWMWWPTILERWMKISEYVPFLSWY